MNFNEAQPSTPSKQNRGRSCVLFTAMVLTVLVTMPVRSVSAQTDRDTGLQTYTPSFLLKPGAFQFKLFNNLYTQTAFFDDDLKQISESRRVTYFTVTSELYYGIHPRVNLGVDLTLKSVRIDTDKSSSPLAVFQFSGGTIGRTAITSFAPKIKFLPFIAVPNLSFQSTFVIPTAGDPEGRFNNRPFLEFNDWQWWNQVFYDHRLSEGSLIFVETGVLFRFDSNPQKPNHEVNTPLKAFVNYYPNNRWTLYLPIDFTPSWGKQGPGGSHFDVESFWIQTGFGTKFQVQPNLELEFLYTNFIVGRNEGAGQTFNVGLRVVR